MTSLNSATSDTNMFPSEKTPKTGNPVANVILRQYKLDLKSRLMEMKSIKTNLRQKQRAKELTFSETTKKTM